MRAFRRSNCGTDELPTVRWWSKLSSHQRTRRNTRCRRLVRQFRSRSGEPPGFVVGAFDEELVMAATRADASTKMGSVDSRRKIATSNVRTSRTVSGISASPKRPQTFASRDGNAAASQRDCSVERGVYSSRLGGPLRHYEWRAVKTKAPLE